jgi:beta-glucanase (GH16 family)
VSLVWAAGCSGRDGEASEPTVDASPDGLFPADRPAAEAGPPDAPDVPDVPTRAGWRLVWSDEFEGAAGTAPDPQKWKFDTGGDGWGNSELQFYTNRRENSALDGEGHLAITARLEGYMGRRYTSARLNTAGRFQQMHGRFEARLKLPEGQGIWPAFWALGFDIGQVGWPACGEIDIMENRGREPAVNHGSLHGPGYSGGESITGTYRLPAGATFPADFHLFAIEWEENVVRFYVDEVLYQTRTPASLPAGTTWVFDRAFFLILNVAVGGTFSGNPDATTSFPQTLLVDHVRVYAR